MGVNALWGDQAQIIFFMGFQFAGDYERPWETAPDAIFKFRIFATGGAAGGVNVPDEAVTLVHSFAYKNQLFLTGSVAVIFSAFEPLFVLFLFLFETYKI